jgi:hypothetical protein
LFWKKKKTSTEKFIHNSSDKREAFRFEFNKENPLEIKFKDKKFSVINISATGLSFENNGLSLDDSGISKFFLTFFNQKSPVPIELEMQIIKIDNNNICHGIYKNISEDNIEIIHKYILEKQKEKIRANKIK